MILERARDEIEQGVAVRFAGVVAALGGVREVRDEQPYAALRDRADRKLWIEAHGESADGTFVRAEALFLAVDITRFANDRMDP